VSCYARALCLSVLIVFPKNYCAILPVALVR
jgi:hypothetical protein